MFDLEKLNDPSMMNVFQATIDGSFAPLATLLDKYAEVYTIVTLINKKPEDGEIS